MDLLDLGLEDLLTAEGSSANGDLAGADAISIGTGTDISGTSKSTRAAPKPKGCSKAAGTYTNCNVCGSTDMARGMKQCKDHNKSLKAFCELREKAPEHPPSEFAALVCEFEQKYPAGGRGKKRGHTSASTAELVQKHTHTSGVQRGLRNVKMHEEEWMHLRVEIQRYPRAEAAAAWKAVKAAISPDLTDQKGPAHSPYRQPMPKEEYVDNYEDISQGNQLCVRPVKKAKADVAAVESMQEELSKDLPAFSNKIFSGVGGSVAGVLSQAGLSGPSQSEVRPGDKNVFSKQIAAAIAEKPPQEETKRRKDVDVEVIRNRALEKLSSVRDKLIEKKNLAIAAREKAIQNSTDSEGKSRADSSSASTIPGLSAVLQTMTGRALLLQTFIQAIGNRGPDAQEPDGAPQTKPEAPELLLGEPFVKAVLEEAGYDFGKKTYPDAMQDGAVKKLTIIQKYFVDKKVLQQALETRLANGGALPFESDQVQNVQPISYFDVMGSCCVPGAKTVDDIKLVDESCNLSRDLAGNLIAFAKKSADEASSFVDRSDKKSNLAAKKASASAETKAAAKKKGESPAKAIQSNTLFDSSHACIKAMQYYATVEDFSKAKSSGKHDATAPHFIESMPRATDAMKGLGVKAALGVFKIQYPVSHQKEEGKGQTAYNGTGQDALREILLEGVGHSASIPELWKGTPTERVFMQVMIYGCTAAMAPLTGPERLGLASGRYQESGVREVIATSVHSLLKFADSVGIVRSEKHGYFDFMSHVAGNLKEDSSMLDKYLEEGGQLLKAKMVAGTYLYMPMGYAVIERTLGDANSYGIRVAVFDKSPETKAGLNEMLKQMDTSNDDSLVKFWKA
ncbi:unnamed protein product, partial [Prorocentrum cordatum]